MDTNFSKVDPSSQTRSLEKLVNSTILWKVAHDRRACIQIIWLLPESYYLLHFLLLKAVICRVFFFFSQWARDLVTPIASQTTNIWTTPGMS